MTDSLGESDWEEQDLLSHGDARERVRAEIAAATSRIGAGRLAEDQRLDHHAAPIDAEQQRLVLLRERLAELDRRLEAR